jgi:peptidoglycan/LPS O-acetylase OafA/YrhL
VEFKLQPKKQTLNILQVYRGFAAVSVVCFHATTTIFSKYNFHSLGGVFSWGFSGVHLFFVLSGFIISFIHFSDIGMPQRASGYLRERFVRIYPIYWVIVFIYLPFFLHDLKIINWSFLIENITLLRITHFEKIILVAWTLSHEILFYFVFLVLILNRLTGVILILGWLLLMLHEIFTADALMPPYILSSITGIDYGVFTNFARLASAPINFLFVLGAASFWTYKKIINQPRAEQLAIASFLIGVAMFCVAGVYCLNEGSYESWGGYYAVFGIASFFLLVASGSAAIEKWASTQHFFLLLGNASYSIYLVHFGLQEYLVHALGSNPFANYNVIFAILIVLPVFIGIISYKYVELPLMRFFGRGRIKSSAA